MQDYRKIKIAIGAELAAIAMSVSVLCFHEMWNTVKSGSLEQVSGTLFQEENEDGGNADSGKKKSDYIKWVDFNVTSEALKQAYQIDVDTYGKEIHLNWIDLLAIVGAKNGGDFKRYKAEDMSGIAETFLSGESTVEEYTKDMKYFSYYREAYGAVLEGMVGEYRIEDTGDVSDESRQWKSCYGLKAFNPIAKGFPYSDYDDFGVARSYGYRRSHLGHDLMGQVGTPIINVESGKVTALGWNQYGGWRIGIESFDGKRYYYYAHLRQNRPYAEGLKVGDVVQAGDVIGYD